MAYQRTKFILAQVHPAKLAHWLLDRALHNLIRRGTLRVHLPGGEVRTYGGTMPTIAISIHDWPTLRRIALNPYLAIGEAWMDGALSVETGDLYEFLALCLRNADEAPTHWLWRANHRMRMAVRRLAMHNPVTRARRNVAHHYDLGDDLYDLFLDPERQYSCAYFQDSRDSLEDAQKHKMRHIAAKLRLEPAQRVLDIGSGWGGLGMYLAHTTGADVTGLTLSVDQERHASARAIREELAGRVRFELRDYRHQTGRFDRIVSVGMFEHVGAGHYREYFAKIAALLEKDGVALLHTIGSSCGPRAPDPWIAKYIFPGGYVPSLSEIVPESERAGLIATDIEVLRLHYAETLRAWRERFLARRDEAAVLYDERFCWMWEFYLAACEAGFRHNRLVVFQIQLAHRLDAVPTTRNYIEVAKRKLPDPGSETSSAGNKPDAPIDKEVAAE